MKRPWLWIVAGLLAPLGSAAFAGAAPEAASSGVVALRAGSAHLVEGGTVLDGGVTVLVRDGKITAIGNDVAIPDNARVVDYGPDATLIPGLVAATSYISSRGGPPRTASPGTRAIDTFDPYSSDGLDDLADGVTTAYLLPARNRLIAGQGAVVKLAGDDPQARILSGSACLHGSISRDARNTPGFWEPPVPATVDVGMGYARPQLPRTTMGAIVALRELLSAVAAGDVDSEYGASAVLELKQLMASGTTWRMRAETVPEIRALLAFAQEHDLPLLLDGVRAAGDVADEIAAAGVGAIVEVDFLPNTEPRDRGKAADAVWPTYDTAAKLQRAGVRIAIAARPDTRASSLRFFAALASRGGLDEAAALRAITLGPAELLGVGQRVGSLTVGKDADIVVLNGPPLAATTTVLATWVEGERHWQVAEAATTTVLSVDALHVGDGEVLRPGEVLMRDGRIVEVGTRVSRPAGAAVVRGSVAMPGIVDALGHLGLEGSSKGVGATYKLARIVEPGDATDRRVARAGVTTVCLIPRGKNSSGVPVMAYKPAGTDLDQLVVRETTALGFRWEDRNRLKSGKDVREILEKAMEYDEKWREYEKAIAAWSPPAAKVEPPKLDEDDDEEEAEEDDESDDEDKDGDDKKSKKKKRKKKGDEPEEPPEVPGIWLGQVTVPPLAEPSRLRVRLELDVQAGTSNAVLGYLRCDPLSDELVDLHGSIDGSELDLRGFASGGRLHLTGKIEKDELSGKITVGATEVDFEVKRETKELKYARRPELRKNGDAEEESKDGKKRVKGEPKKPKVDDKLELMRAAMRGELVVLVDVRRADEILACVDAFEEAGIRPILGRADDAWRVADRIQGRVAGVLLSNRVLRDDDLTGLRGRRNRYAELASAGIPVAFHSGAEEGASELALIASYAITQGMSPVRALGALTSTSAEMMGIGDRVGRIAVGLDADVLLLDGPPLEPATSVLRTWVAGTEVR